MNRHINNFNSWIVYKRISEYGFNSTGVVEEVRILGSLARRLVSKLLCWILLVDFFFSSKFEDLENMTSYFTLTASVVWFKTLILLLLLS